jgi:alkylation response protein AidB-like acyl-CoA dehydrogenase
MASKITSRRFVGEERRAPAIPSVPQPARPKAGALAAQVARSAAALEEAMEKQDLSIFYRAFRATDLPILAPLYRADPRGLYGACFAVLRRLGSISPAVGVAVYNHYAVTCSLATFPTDQPELAARREEVLQSLLSGRLLVANTTSRVHTDKVGTFGTIARADGDGYRISGSAAYMSLATESALVFSFTQVEGQGFAIFLAPLPNDQIEIGPYLFPRAMIDSDTRRVTFHDAFVSAENMLLLDRRMGSWQMAWHQALFPLPFLGAAARALDEARKFLRTVRGPSDRPLAELDGMVLDVGRMAIRYRGACALARQAGETLEAIAHRPHRPQKPIPLGDAYLLAAAAKQTGTKCAEEIVQQVRHIIGGRTFTGDHPLERLSQEVMFAPLGGELNAVIERQYGQLALGEGDFVSYPW